MPQSLPHPCAHPGCPGLTRERYCDRHKREVDRAYNQARGSASQRGYGARWRKIRAIVLAEEPLCRECARNGKIVVATDVDHIDGNVENMARSNLCPLCHECHSRKTAKENARWGGRAK